MKILLVLLLSSAAALAQTTNLAFRVSVETVNGGVTNTVNSTIRLDFGNEKEAFTINGFADVYNKAVASGETNTFPVFIREELKKQFVRAHSVHGQNLSKQSSAVQLIPLIVERRWEDLTQAQKNQLAAIAAAFPTP